MSVTLWPNANKPSFKELCSLLYSPTNSIFISLLNSENKSRLSEGTHIKICIVTISLAGGGAERSCAMLSEMLAAQGHEVHIATLNDAVDYPYAGTLFNMGEFKQGKDHLGKRYRRFKHFRNYLIANSIDMIIDHRPKNQYYRELFYHHYVYKGLKRIYVTHSSSPALYFTQLPKKFVKLLNRNAANVAVSAYIENEVMKPLGVRSTCTIHNAFDPRWKEINNDLPAALANASYILSYGRIDEAVKDYSFLIRAFDHSELWRENIKLVIMGDGPDKSELQKLAKDTAAANNILFLPHDSAPFKIIQNARFITLTSHFEGFPMVLVESLSMGTPVISLDIVSGPSEIIQQEKNGLLVPKREVSLFASAMRNMVDNETLYENCRTNARESVEPFSFNKISEKWNKLIADVTG